MQRYSEAMAFGDWPAEKLAFLQLSLARAFSARCQQGSPEEAHGSSRTWGRQAGVMVPSDRWCRF